MKFMNPTDEELNAAFAERVAGWNHIRSFIRIRTHDRIHILKGFPPGVKRSRSNRTGRRVPDFTQSTDAVLPWLEKAGRWSVFREAEGLYEIELNDKPMPDDGVWFAFDKSFPRAAVIALLRAHGVKVEFT